MSSIWANWCMLDNCVCVLSLDITTPTWWREKVMVYYYYYEGVIVPTALYAAEACGMRSALRREVNVLEMNCLISLVRVSRMDKLRNGEVRRRAGIE